MKIKKDNVTITDTMDRLVENDGKITCGCDNPELTGITFIDGDDFYSNTYQCDCGNIINVTGKRSFSC